VTGAQFEQLRPGLTIAIDGAEGGELHGTIATVRRPSANRAVLLLRLGSGDMAFVTVAPEADDDAVRVYGPPMTFPQAEHLACAVLSGRSVAMPVTQQLNLLAAAVVAAVADGGEHAT
jgi:hypothetical protein